MMARSPLIAVALALLLAARAAPQPNPLAPGLTDDEVRQRLGAPAFVSRQILLHRSVEQWHYAAPHHLRLTFDCERGRKPTLRESRATRPANP